MNLRTLAIVIVVTFAARCFASDRLVYAVTHNGKSEIFSVSREDTQPKPVLSDEATTVKFGFMWRSGTGAHPDTAVLGNHMYAPGKELTSSSGGRATGIYDFALDGSGTVRKILDLPPEERVDLLSVTNDGSKLAYLSLTGNSLTLFVHDLKTGGLRHKIDVLKIAGGCNVSSIGWLQDNTTLSFTLEEGPADAPDDSEDNPQETTVDEPSVQVGTWLVHEDGTSLTHLPAPTGTLHEAGYRTLQDPPPVMLGEVDEKYIFEVALQNLTGKPQIFSALALADPKSGESRRVTPQGTGFSQFTVSRSGKFVAYIQRDADMFVGNKHVVPPTHLWIRPVAGGDAREMLSMEVSTETRTALTLIGWASE